MGLKRLSTAGLLAMLFGPFGMLYTSFAAFLVFGFCMTIALVNKSDWFFVLYPLSIFCNMWMAKEHNDKIKDLFTLRGAR